MSMNKLILPFILSASMTSVWANYIYFSCQNGTENLAVPLNPQQNEYRGTGNPMEAIVDRNARSTTEQRVLNCRIHRCSFETQTPTININERPRSLAYVFTLRGNDQALLAEHFNTNVNMSDVTARHNQILPTGYPPRGRFPRPLTDGGREFYDALREVKRVRGSRDCQLPDATPSAPQAAP